MFKSAKQYSIFYLLIGSVVVICPLLYLLSSCSLRSPMPPSSETNSESSIGDARAAEEADLAEAQARSEKKAREELVRQEAQARAEKARAELARQTAKARAEKKKHEELIRKKAQARADKARLQEQARAESERQEAEARVELAWLQEQALFDSVRREEQARVEVAVSDSIAARLGNINRKLKLAREELASTRLESEDLGAQLEDLNKQLASLEGTDQDLNMLVYRRQNEIARLQEQLRKIVYARAVAVSNDSEDELYDGQVAFKAPSLMIVGESYFINLLVGVLSDEKDAVELEAELRDGLGPNSDGETTEISNTKLASRITVKIVSPGLEILSVTPEEQFVGQTGTTAWTWSISALRPGKHILVVNLQTEVRVAGGQVIPRVLKTIQRIVEVKSLDTLFEDQAEPKLSLPSEDQAVPAFSLRSEDQAVPAFSLRSAPIAEPCAVEMGDSSNRFALLVTNQAYQPDVGELKNVYGDGDVLKKALISHGFSVQVCRDLGISAFKQVMREFNGQIDSASKRGKEPEVFFYFSGHGAALEGAEYGNYLLSVDASSVDAFSISQDGIKLDAIMTGLSASGAKTMIVVSDACRNIVRSKGWAKGFQPLGYGMKSQFLFGYATAWGEVALDNGHYARELSAALGEVDGTAESVFNRVQERVSSATLELQRPSYEDGLTRPYRF